MKRFQKYSTAAPVTSYGIALSLNPGAFNLRWLLGARVIIWTWKRI